MIDEKIVIEELCSKFRKISEDEIEGAEDLEWNRCLTMAIAEINRQPQVQPIVITQGDRIRAMSDEELAEFIYDVNTNCIPVTTCEGECENCPMEDEYCKNGYLEWLQSEEKEV